MPIDEDPAATAAIAYSICTNLPEGENVVKLKLYLSDMVLQHIETF